MRLVYWQEREYDKPKYMGSGCGGIGMYSCGRMLLYSPGLLYTQPNKEVTEG